MVMAQQFFKSRPNTDPVLVQRANEKLGRSYDRLRSFECSTGGFEWFGRGDGHEALTAFGIMQFQDMSKVYPVDEVMLQRTRDWLESRRDGEGGFKVNPRFLHAWGAPKHISDAYIVWALTESGNMDVELELENLHRDTANHDDPYYTGLVALSLFNVGRDDDARKLLARIAKHQQDDGTVINAKTTVVTSRGQALLIETTAIAALAMLKDDTYAGHVERAVQWIISRSENGRFGSTQSTVLALKAIIAYDKARAKPEADGTVLVLVNGQIRGEVAFTKDTVGGVELPDFSDFLTPGTHRVELQMLDGSPMPFSLEVNYYTVQPNNHPECPLDLEVSLSDTEINEGETTEVNVTVTNLDKKAGQNMAMVIVGMPGGLEPRHERLRELRDAGVIDSYEVLGRDVVFYFTMLTPGQKVDFSFDAAAAVPGEYTGQASRTYLYYGDEYRKWVEGLKVKINAR
jgi:alpha-2-macroglobulin-like protein